MGEDACVVCGSTEDWIRLSNVTKECGNCGARKQLNFRDDVWEAPEAT